MVQSQKLPLWFKHFDSGKNGAGEAYHIGIFGKTGSGKSVLAKMILLAYARYRNMGLFILDPQGQFSKGLRNTSLFLADMEDILSSYTLKELSRSYTLYDLDTISLNRWELFCEFLIEFKFFSSLGIKSSDYQRDVADDVEEFLRNNNKITFASLNEDILTQVLGLISRNIHKIYAGAAGQERVKENIEEVQNAVQAGDNHKVKTIWQRVTKLFNPTNKMKPPREIINEALKATANVDGKIIVIDLSKRPEEIPQYVWDDKIKPLIIDCFLDDLIRVAEYSYQEGKSLNTLVVMDEAHRLAPRERTGNERKERIKATLIDAIRTTRKYGLGWLFISQTLSSLDKAIIEQLRIYFFGFGLSMGTEFQALRETVGGDPNSLKLYQSFRDPHSSFDISSRQYSFMTVGPVSPLSFAGTPLFFTAFNTPELFINANNLVKKKKTQ